MKNGQLYPEATMEIAEKRAVLAPEITEALRNFSKLVFKEGALSEKTKQLIAVAVVYEHNALIAYAAILRRLCEKEQAKKRSWRLSG